MVSNRLLSRVLPAMVALALTVVSACSPGTPAPDPMAPLDGRGGGFIAFHSFRDGNGEIYVMNADGSGAKRLTTTPGEDSCPHFSPDAAQIVFTSERDGNAQVYVINRDGTNPQRLTQTDAKEMHPAWTPDGGRIVYARGGDLWIMDAGGTNQTQLTRGLRAELPFVTADGRRVVYSDMSAGNYDVNVMNIDGSDIKPVFAGAEMEVFARPAPTGNRLALMRGGRNITVVGFDGADPQRLRSGGENPCWSPDGSGLAFHSTQTGNYEIYRMDADGRNVVNLTRNSGNDFWPSWAAAR